MKKFVFLTLITCISVCTFAGTYGVVYLQLNPNGTQYSDSDYDSESYDMKIGNNELIVSAYANLTYAGQGDLYARAKISWSCRESSGSIQAIAEADSYSSDGLVDPPKRIVSTTDQDNGAYSQAWVEYWDYAQGSVWAKCRFNDD